MLRYLICKVSPSVVIDLRQAAVTLITTGHEKIKNCTFPILLREEIKPKLIYGCYIMKVKKFELHTRARIQAVSWERCPFSHEILTF